MEKCQVVSAVSNKWKKRLAQDDSHHSYDHPSASSHSSAVCTLSHPLSTPPVFLGHLFFTPMVFFSPPSLWFNPSFSMPLYSASHTAWIQTFHAWTWNEMLITKSQTCLCFLPKKFTVCPCSEFFPTIIECLLCMEERKRLLAYEDWERTPLNPPIPPAHNNLLRTQGCWLGFSVWQTINHRASIMGRHISVKEHACRVWIWCTACSLFKRLPQCCRQSSRSKNASNRVMAAQVTRQSAQLQHLLSEEKFFIYLVSCWLAFTDAVSHEMQVSDVFPLAMLLSASGEAARGREWGRRWACSVLRHAFFVIIAISSYFLLLLVAPPQCSPSQLLPASSVCPAAPSGKSQTLSGATAACGNQSLFQYHRNSL